MPCSNKFLPEILIRSQRFDILGSILVRFLYWVLTFAHIKSKFNKISVSDEHGLYSDSSAAISIFVHKNINFDFNLILNFFLFTVFTVTANTKRLTINFNFIISSNFCLQFFAGNKIFHSNFCRNSEDFLKTSLKDLKDVKVSLFEFQHIELTRTEVRLSY